VTEKDETFNFNESQETQKPVNHLITF